MPQKRSKKVLALHYNPQIMREMTRISLSNIRTLIYPNKKPKLIELQITRGTPKNNQMLKTPIEIEQESKLIKL